jgi:hypothetical protein
MPQNKLIVRKETRKNQKKCNIYIQKKNKKNSENRLVKTVPEIVKTGVILRMGSINQESGQFFKPAPETRTDGSLETENRPTLVFT